MKRKVSKTTPAKSTAAPTAQLHEERSVESVANFTDNRPQAIAQRKLNESIQSSPRSQQINAYQTIINGSAPLQQMKSYQTIAHQPAQPIAQKKENIESNGLPESVAPVQQKENNTGLPDGLKTGVENLSGYSMDDVKVHYNSDKPAQLQAHAFAQGTDIHMAPGQEKHLGHEAWHVVQQKQGRVQPTVQMKGKVNVNDDAGLEQEADVMGAKASGSSFEATNQPANNNLRPSDPALQFASVVQREAYPEAKKVSDHYEKERTEQRPDLASVVERYSTVIKKFAIAIDEITPLASDRSADAALTAAKAKAPGIRESLPDKGAGMGVRKLKEVIEPLGKQRTLKKLEYEKNIWLTQGRMQDIGLSDAGDVDKALLGARLVSYDETPESQDKTLVTVSGGALTRSPTHDTDPGASVSTGGSVTQHTGKGWEIFVMSPGGELHMASHKIGKYHHSSLLAGVPVAAAGTIKASGGNINILNDKSGHYMPTKANMMQVLHMLKTHGVNLDSFRADIATAGYSGLASGFYTNAEEESVEHSITKRAIEQFVTQKGFGAVADALERADISLFKGPHGKPVPVKGDGKQASEQEVRDALQKRWPRQSIKPNIV